MYILAVYVHHLTGSVHVDCLLLAFASVIDVKSHKYDHIYNQDSQHKYDEYLEELVEKVFYFFAHYFYPFCISYVFYNNIDIFFSKCFCDISDFFHTLFLFILFFIC